MVSGTHRRKGVQETHLKTGVAAYIRDGKGLQMAAVALIVASRALKVLHLAVDGLAADDVQYLPALQGMQSTSAWSHTLKAEPYTDSAHGWQVENSHRVQPAWIECRRNRVFPQRTARAGIAQGG